MYRFKCANKKKEINCYNVAVIRFRIQNTPTHPIDFYLPSRASYLPSHPRHRLYACKDEDLDCSAPRHSLYLPSRASCPPRHPHRRLYAWKDGDLGCSAPRHSLCRQVDSLDCPRPVTGRYDTVLTTV